VGVDVVDEDRQKLGIAAASGAWAHHAAVLRPRLVALLADHDDSIGEGELAVFDAAALTFDQQPHLEPEGATQPVDRRAGVGIEERGRNAWPAGRGALHAPRPGVSAEEIFKLDRHYCQRPLADSDASGVSPSDRWGTVCQLVSPPRRQEEMAQLTRDRIDRGAC
jgi:hypothetical protein